MGFHFLLQGIFPTQGSNPGLPHCRQTLYPLSHHWVVLESPKYLKIWYCCGIFSSETFWTSVTIKIWLCFSTLEFSAISLTVNYKLWLPWCTLFCKIDCKLSMDKVRYWHSTVFPHSTSTPLNPQQNFHFVIYSLSRCNEITLFSFININIIQNIST